VAVQEITQNLADALGMAKPGGALVARIVRGGPAERAGMKVGDVIIEFEGKKVTDAMDLPLWIARTPVEKRVVVKVQRDRKELDLDFVVSSLPEGAVQSTVNGNG
jgi:serine protease Do